MQTRSHSLKPVLAARKGHGRVLPTLGALVAAFTAMEAWPIRALAASLGDLALRAESDIGKFGRLIQVGAFVAGLGLVVTGLMNLSQTSHQPGAPKGPALTRILVGVILLGLAVFIQAVSGTFGGEGASQGIGRLGIGG
ncbi:MAG: hypothetical protein LBR22_05685 [Desulfovibrio sp.]|jgi:hypothetical protein|nr:hypothetical protein [Desulfovibrio sp.]